MLTLDTTTLCVRVKKKTCIVTILWSMRREKWFLSLCLKLVCSIRWSKGFPFWSWIERLVSFWDVVFRSIRKAPLFPYAHLSIFEFVTRFWDDRFSILISYRIAHVTQLLSLVHVPSVFTYLNNNRTMPIVGREDTGIRSVERSLTMTMVVTSRRNCTSLYVGIL